MEPFGPILEETPADPSLQPYETPRRRCVQNDVHAGGQAYPQITDRLHNFLARRAETSSCCLMTQFTTLSVRASGQPENTRRRPQPEWRCSGQQSGAENCLAAFSYALMCGGAARQVRSHVFCGLWILPFIERLISPRCFVQSAIPSAAASSTG